MKKRIGILTGGGDVQPLNAVIASARMTASNMGVELVGILKGWEGALEGKFVDLASRQIDPSVGGTILKSSRVNIGRLHDGPARILDNFEKNEISSLIVIGGEDTLSLAFLLPSFPQVLIAKTIDNDVGLWRESGPGFDPRTVMNYFTLGFPTAAERIISFVSLKEGLRTTAYSHERIIIVESMGMHAGWLALSSSLGYPDFIILPEFPLEYDFFLDRVLKRYNQQKHLVIVVAEGARLSDGSFIHAGADEIEAFGHPRFGGAAYALQERLKTDLAQHFPTRNINAVNPAYLYRSGSPNRLDYYWAQKLGESAVQILADGIANSVFLAIEKGEPGFFIRDHPLSEFSSISDLHRFVDPKLYDSGEMRATPYGMEYLREILREIPYNNSYGI